MNEKYVPTKTKIKIGLWYKYQITLKEEKKILETKWFCMLIKLLIPSGRKNILNSYGPMYIIFNIYKT